MITIVTITFNNFKELIETVKSVPKTSSIEHVVINGGNCARTQEFLATQFDGTVVTERDEGIADAFNKGARHSRGIGVAYLNSGDIYVGGDYYDTANDILTSRPEVDFVHSNLEFHDEIAGDLYMRPTMGNLGRGMPYLHPTMIIRKRVFEQIGYFPLAKRIGMDFDLVCRMHKGRLKGMYLDRLPVVHMDGSGVSATNEEQSLHECYVSLREHGLLNIENRLGFISRYGLYKLRRLLIVMGLRGVLGYLKKRKHSRA